MKHGRLRATENLTLYVFIESTEPKKHHGIVHTRNGRPWSAHSTVFKESLFAIETRYIGNTTEIAMGSWTHHIVVVRRIPTKAIRPKNVYHVAIVQKDVYYTRDEILAHPTEEQLMRNIMVYL